MEFDWEGLGFILTFLVGIASMLKYFLIRLDKKFEAIDKKFDKVDERFAKVDERFEKVDQKFEELIRRMDDRFEKVDNKFEEILKRMDARFDRVDERLQRIEYNISDLNVRVTVSEMRLEERKGQPIHAPLAISQRRRRGPNKNKGGADANP